MDDHRSVIDNLSDSLRGLLKNIEQRLHLLPDTRDNARIHLDNARIQVGNAVTSLDNHLKVWQPPKKEEAQEQTDAANLKAAGLEDAVGAAAPPAASGPSADPDPQDGNAVAGKVTGL